MSTKVILFDIDGTLLRAHGAGARALLRAAEHVLGERCRGAVIKYGGALDPWIFRKLAEHGGYELTDAVHASFRMLYTQMLVEELARAERKCEAMPGVHALMATLRQRPIATVGLLTGNYAETGALKLRAAGLDPQHFEIAAWGDMAAERPGLVPVALAQLKRSVQPCDVIVVGDTVRDVECAHQNGAFCVAVATGGGTSAELHAAGADVVLDSLQDTAGFLRLLG